MIRAVRILCATAGLFAGAAQATAIFTWQPISNGTLGQPAVGSVDLSDAALAAGRANVDYITRSAVPVNPAVERVRFEGLSTTARQQPGSGPGGAPQLFWSGTDRITADLTVSGGLLLGTIWAQATQDELRMASDNAGLWLVSYYGSESTSRPCRNVTGNVGGPAPFCSGMTGRFVLTSGGSAAGGGSGQVPLPGVLPLMALASFGAAASLRRRAQ